MSTLNELPIVATLVPEDKRLDFFPSHLGRYFLHGEMLIMDIMGRISPSYDGGFWNFYTLSNGGFYVAPHTNKRMELEIESNYFSGIVTADAAGIVATMFALNRLSNSAKDELLVEQFINQFFLLKDFIHEHAESTLIFRAID